MAKSNGKRTIVKSAARALDILELLVQFPGGLTLTGVGEHLDIPLSSLHNLMNTLLSRGYLTRDERASVYRLSSKLVQLAAAHHSQHDLVSVAEPVMDTVSKASEESTSLAVLQDNAVVFIHKRAANNFVQVVNPVGTRILAHATGLGKVLLANFDDGELDQLYPDEELPALTPATISRRSKLKEVLKRVREQGYAIDNAESSEGVWAVAAAIHSRSRTPIAALSVAAPLYRVTDEKRKEWCRLVREGADEISRMMGFFA